MNAPRHRSLTIGPWQAHLETGRLERPGEVREVEPKVMDLLFLLASRPNEVFSREEILRTLWPKVTVGEDALSRAVFKLRRALSDDPQAPSYIETIPKRGYRLIIVPSLTETPAPARQGPWRAIAAAAALLIVAGAAAGLYVVRSDHQAQRSAEELTRRADDSYFQFRRLDNEAAIALYERAVAAEADSPRALAGLANALVQRVIRWSPGAADGETTTLPAALASGRTRTPDAVRQLARARALAERGVRLAPSDSATLKAYGFVLAAQGDIEGARREYLKALAADPDAWGVLINLADLSDIGGRKEESLRHLERAYDAMSRVYDEQAVRVRPWQAALGVAIGDRHQARGRPQQAEVWYRRVLAYAPYDRAATLALARHLSSSGDEGGARRLCEELAEKTGAVSECPARGLSD